MRTFHTGGIAGEDITHGLPRVVELFEARTPKGAAVLARTSGVVRIAETRTTAAASPSSATTAPRRRYNVLAARPPRGRREGQEVTAGDALVEGPKDPKELLEIKGIRETQQYLVDEVQKVYRDQGVSIHDKHIELIVRQMLRRVVGGRAGRRRRSCPASASTPAGLRRDQPRAGAGGQASGRGPSRADGHHQGVAGHRLVAVGGVVPGDHPGAHRGGHRGQERPAPRPQGEHHHRQAHPGRHRACRATARSSMDAPDCRADARSGRRTPSAPRTCRSGSPAVRRPRPTPPRRCRGSARPSPARRPPATPDSEESANR